MPEIALALLEQAADVIVISEYRRTMGGQLRALLAEHGWEHQLCTDPNLGKNGMLLASRHPLVERRSPVEPPVDGRWLHAHLPGLPLEVIGIHAPDGQTDPTLQTAYWRYLIDTIRGLQDSPCVVLGDFNTGRHKADESGKTFRCTSLLGLLCTLGYTDAWRSLHPQTREFTWFSHTGGGFRIDAAYVSRGLVGRLQDASHVHALRQSGTSDHAPIRIELDLAPGAAPLAQGANSPQGTTIPGE